MTDDFDINFLCSFRFLFSYTDYNYNHISINASKDMINNGSIIIILVNDISYKVIFRKPLFCQTGFEVRVLDHRAGVGRDRHDEGKTGRVYIQVTRRLQSDVDLLLNGLNGQHPVSLMANTHFLWLFHVAILSFLKSS